MATERTFSIIKPDATRRNLTGKVNAVLEAAGLRIVAQKRIHMSQAQAESFYGVHAARPFFRDLVTFMISGPVVVQVVEGENAVTRNRDVMGAIFISAGYNKAMAPTATMPMMGHYGLPLPGAAYAVTLIVELGVGTV